MAKSSFSNERGFSLLETLVATTLMTVALASLAQLFLISTKANQSARLTTTASVPLGETTTLVTAPLQYSTVTMRATGRLLPVPPVAHDIVPARPL